jgi:hypothetical protein
MLVRMLLNVIGIGRVSVTSPGRTGATDIIWVILGGAGHLASELLKGLSLGFGDEKGGEDAHEHKEREDLHDVVQPRRRGAARWCAPSAERSNESLGEDGTNLARGSGDTVGGRSVTRREAFAGHDECGCVGAEVEKELAQNVESEKSVTRQLFEGEADDAEENGEKEESNELDWLTADSVNESDGEPVTGDGTSTNEDEVADGGFVEDVVDVTKNKGLARV